MVECLDPPPFRRNSLHNRFKEDLFAISKLLSLDKRLEGSQNLREKPVNNKKAENDPVKDRRNLNKPAKRI